MCTAISAGIFVSNIFAGAGQYLIVNAEDDNEPAATISAQSESIGARVGTVECEQGSTEIIVPVYLFGDYHATNLAADFSCSAPLKISMASNAYAYTTEDNGLSAVIGSGIGWNDGDIMTELTVYIDPDAEPGEYPISINISELSGDGRVEEPVGISGCVKIVEQQGEPVVTTAVTTTASTETTETTALTTTTVSEETTGTTALTTTDVSEEATGTTTLTTTAVPEETTGTTALTTTVSEETTETTALTTTDVSEETTETTTLTTTAVPEETTGTTALTTTVSEETTETTALTTTDVSEETTGTTALTTTVPEATTTTTNESDLPQTGNNSLKAVSAVSSALVLSVIGTFAVTKSRTVRRKEQE